MAAMGLSAYCAHAKARIDGELNARFGEWFPGLPEAQRGALRGIVADGKRLRGLVTCLVAEALGADFERALPAAVAVEMIQAASLVHDDFVDGDTERRGRAAAWTALSPRRAVLLADLMFATAIERMARAGERECAAVAQAIATMAQGALQEAQQATSAGGAGYRRLIELKTGSLFAAAARLGALAAGGDERTLEAATRFGARIGAAYQVADDLEDEDPAPERRQRLETELEVLLGEARAALGAFPDNEWKPELAGIICAPTRSPSRTP